jgi:hypothetical protein
MPVISEPFRESSEAILFCKKTKRFVIFFFWLFGKAIIVNLPAA